ARCDTRTSGGSRYHFRLPTVLALSAPHRLRQLGVSPALAGASRARGTHSRTGRRDRPLAAHRGQADQSRDRALGRTDAARGDRPRTRPPPVDLLDGRAAVVAGRQVARRVSRGTEAYSARG